MRLMLKGWLKNGPVWQHFLQPATCLVDGKQPPLKPDIEMQLSALSLQAKPEALDESVIAAVKAATARGRSLHQHAGCAPVLV